MATGLQQGKDSGPGGGTSQRPSGRTPRRRTLGLAVVAALAASPAVQAGPEGGRVVAGSATITQTTPNRLDVVQSSGKAIVDWRSFSIGAGEQTHFQQPSSASVALNRVKGGDPSRILGQLTANGQVMLVNPNGVFFGPGSRVDVGALMASTADIANDDFLAGRYRFTTPSPNPNAGIVHQGEIRAADGGFVVLAAPYVRNEGSIQARLGQVVLAGAPTFTVDFDGDGLLQFDVGGPVTVAPRGDDGQAVDALVANLGTVQADGGRVTLTARAADQVIDRVIHMGGVVQAQTVESRGGEIVLSTNIMRTELGNMIRDPGIGREYAQSLVITTDNLGVQMKLAIDTTRVVETMQLPKAADWDQFYFRFLGDYRMDIEIDGKKDAVQGEMLHEYMVL